ncbi:MAG: discoidin domain-containing protein [Kiritimatiellae bacterium]|nr:discoidin domain-containing protein [Kiritimatiellia bacterium]
MKNTILLLALLLSLAAPSARADDPTPVKLSRLGRSMFYRGGRGYVGDAGFNGGSYMSHVFNGTFTDYRIQNTAGAEIVIPTTGLDEDEQDTGVAWYVTEFKVGHAGNTKYSLYYTTEPAPDYSALELKQDQDSNKYYEVDLDPRTWIPIPGATGVQAEGTKSFAVNAVATAVKYVFDTTLGWTGSLGEVEVWGVDPASVGCQHPSYTEWEEVPGSATCTTYGIKRRKCQVCGEVFELDSALPLGHDWEENLLTPGSSSSYGRGTLVCTRCGEAISFYDPIDLAEQGGIAAPGAVQFTTLTVSSTGNPDWGCSPSKLIDGNWEWHLWSDWHALTHSHDEWIQFDFEVEIDLTKIDFLVHDHTQTVEFYKVEDDVETAIAEVAITGTGSTDESASQRKAVSFRGLSLKTLRIRIADSTGIAVNGSYPLCMGEIHPWGTVKGAGLLDVRRSRILLY